MPIGKAGDTPNYTMQLTTLRVAADRERRWADVGTMKLLPFLLASALLLPCCSEHADASLPRSGSVSLIELIASPSSFDGKRVQVIGVLDWQFEGDALFLAKEHREHHVYRHSLWLSYDPGFRADQVERLKALSGRYVQIEGTFSQANRGHMALWPGAIVDIDSVVVRERD